MLPFNKPLGVEVLAVALSFALAGPGQGNEDLYRKLAPSTAVIYKTGPFPNGFGSGFLVDAKERLLVTARHVLEKPGGGIVDSATVIFAQTKDGEIITDVGHYRKKAQTLSIRGKVVYDSVRRDMAVLQLDTVPSGVKPLVLAAKPARPAQTIHVIGNSTETLGGVFNYCQGYVRNVFHWDMLGARVLATQAPVNKGDSGGPMLNGQGEVVGLAFMTGSMQEKYKLSALYDMQVTALGVCVSEIREGLKELRTQLAKADKQPESSKTTSFKGQTQAGVHFVAMDKDILYRIKVKAAGFVPDLRIDNLLLNPTPTPWPAGAEAEYLYTPKESKQYRFQISPFPGRDIVKGSPSYALNVEEVAFQTETVFKERELRLNEVVRKFQTGKMYKITVRGKGFEPDVQIIDGTKALLTRLNNANRGSAGGAAERFAEAVGLTDASYETSLMFAAPKTAEYRIVIAISPFSTPRKTPFDYTLEIGEQKAELWVSAKLTSADPLYRQLGPFKSHPVKLAAGKTYQIDMITTAFDSRVVLEDSIGNVLMEGFDAEGFNGRLVYRATKTDTYRVIATAHERNATGSYIVTVAENPDARQGPPRFDMKQGKNPK
jgi:hypothetical protein